MAQTAARSTEQASETNEPAFRESEIARDIIDPSTVEPFGRGLTPRRFATRGRYPEAGHGTTAGNSPDEGKIGHTPLKPREAADRPLPEFPN
jgi:hypothetical protein